MAMSVLVNFSSAGAMVSSGLASNLLPSRQWKRVI